MSLILFSNRCLISGGATYTVDELKDEDQIFRAQCGVLTQCREAV